MKLASFLSFGPGGRARSDPDTAIVDDDLGGAIDALAPNTIADVTLMAPAMGGVSNYNEAIGPAAAGVSGARLRTRAGNSGSFATRLPTPRATAAAILTLALLKSILLLWHFMDLRHAHFLWKASLGLLTTGMPVLVFVLMN